MQVVKRSPLRINSDLTCRNSRVRPERKVSPRMVSNFPRPSVTSPRPRILFQFLKRREKKAIRTYVRSGKNNKCYGSCVAEPALAINHVSRVLKSTSKFSFKSHAVRFIKEHY